jgi:hypothetical protein
MKISSDITRAQPTNPIASLTLAGFVLLISFATLLERFGISSAVILHTELALVLVALMCMAWFTGTMVLLPFFTPARSLGFGSILSAAGTWLLAASLLTGFMIFPLFGLLLVLGFGLRPGQLFSLRQALCQRFPSLTARMILSPVIIASALILSASGFEACTELLMRGFALHHFTALALTSAAILIPLLAGGYSALLIVTSCAGILTLAAFGLSLISYGVSKPVSFELGSFFAAIWPQNDILRLADVQVLHFLYPDILEGLRLISVFMLILSLSMAAVQCCAANLTEGFIKSGQNFATLSSQRLARNRLALVAVVIVCLCAAYYQYVQPESGLQLSICLNLALLSPVCILALWPRAQSDAVQMTFYVTAAVMAGTFIYDGYHVVQNHLLTALVCAIPAACAGGLWIVVDRHTHSDRYES